MSYSLPINNNLSVSRSVSLASTDSDREAYSELLKDISDNPNFFGSSAPPSRSNSSTLYDINQNVSHSVSRSVSTESDRAYVQLLHSIANDPKFFGISAPPSRSNSQDLLHSNSHIISSRSISNMSLGITWYSSTESIPVVQNNTKIEVAKKTSNGKIVEKASYVSKKGKINPKLSTYSKTRKRIRGRFVRNTEYDKETNV
jgi:hypothetical protein